MESELHVLVVKDGGKFGIVLRRGWSSVPDPVRLDLGCSSAVVLIPVCGSWCEFEPACCALRWSSTLMTDCTISGMNLAKHLSTRLSTSTGAMLDCIVVVAVAVAVVAVAAAHVVAVASRVGSKPMSSEALRSLGTRDFFSMVMSGWFNSTSFANSCSFYHIPSGASGFQRCRALPAGLRLLLILRSACSDGFPKASAPRVRRPRSVDMALVIGNKALVSFFVLRSDLKSDLKKALKSFTLLCLAADI